jgi:hypothetical protein
MRCNLNWRALKNSCNCQAKKDKKPKKETAEVGKHGRGRGNLSSRKHSHSGMKTNVLGVNENRQLVNKYIYWVVVDRLPAE